jgi:RNA polymerase sigma-70 factor (ECF subfamily)
VAIDDEALIAKVVAGDSEALAGLLERFGPIARRQIAGKIPPRWQSILSEDDVMQQTYADAIRAIRGFKPCGSEAFAAWLKTIAKRNLYDAIKALKAERRGGDRQRIEPTNRDDSSLDLFRLLGGSSTTPSRCAAREEAKAILQKTISRLPEAYRRVVQMYDLEGRSAQEIADELGRSPGAIFMLRARAHARMREEMGTASDFLSDSP